MHWLVVAMIKVHKADLLHEQKEEYCQGETVWKIRSVKFEIRGISKVKCFSEFIFLQLSNMLMIMFSMNNFRV